MQALHVEAISRFCDGGGLWVGTSRVLQVGYYLAVFGKGDHVAIGLGHRPEGAWQAQREAAQPRLVGHVVSSRVAGLGKAHPDLAVQAAHQVVGVTRQVVEQHAGLRAGTRTHIDIACLDIDFPDAVLAGFGDEQVLLVAAQRNAVGESQAAGHDARGLRGRVVFEHAPGRSLFEDVEHAGPGVDCIFELVAAG